MFALDLFNTRYERELREGAVDDLEARRIDDLNAKMDDLLARARTAKTPEHKAGLKREFEKVKNERDSYFKIKEQQVPSKQDPFAYVKPEPKGIGDLQDPKQKMAQLQQKAKKGPLANVGAGLKAFFKGEPEPMDEEQVDQSSSGPRAYGVANFQRLVKANMGNVPTVTLEFAKSEDNIKLDQAGIDLISDYYDGLNSDQTKNHFIYRVLPSADEVRTVLKKLGWNPQAQQPLPGIPTQGELPLAEKKKFDNSSDLEAGDVKVARELQKLRAQYPAARSDLEAVARAELDSSERSQQQLAAIKGANEKQDALLKQLVSLDQEQGREIDDLDQENNTLEKRLAQVQSTNDRLQQAIGQMTGTKKADSKSDTTKVNKSSQDDADNINDKVSPVAEPAPKEKSKSAPTVTPKPEKVNTKSAAIDSMARQIAGFNQPAPELDATVSDKETASDTDSDVIQRPSKLRVLRPKVATNADEFKLTGTESKIKEHGGGIGPRQHWQDLMPEQSNTDDDWYDDEPETELRSGDYVRDTMDGEHGEIFRMQGDPYERRVRILDRDGKGWYIEPSRLIRVDANDMDVQKYFGKKRVRDMDEQSVATKSQANAIPRKSVIQGYTVFWNPSTKTVSVTRGGDSEEAAIEQARLGVVNLTSFRRATDRLIDRIDNVTESALKDKADLDAKRKALQDLSMNKDVDQKAVQQRKLDLEKEAKAKGLGEGWSDRYVAQRTGRPRTPYSVYINGKKWKDFANDDHARAVMDKLKAKFKADGRDPSVITIAPTDIPEGVAEGLMKEPANRKEYLDQRDKLFRMMSMETNPANKQIIKQAINDLQARYGNLKNAVKEESSTDSEAVEIAIIKRILVAHTDLIMEFGLDKVTQAIEEVAYNVGDVDEIGTSDVSAYVNQVKQILGVPEEVNEKWSQKYKSSINCASPKGFSQKAHCAGRKK
jgi:hypothetical protein